MNNIYTLVLELFPQKTLNSIERIGGMTNLNYLLDFGTDRYVLRIPNKGTNTFISRQNEMDNNIMAMNANLTPEILYIDSKSGIKITKYIEPIVPINNRILKCNIKICEDIILLIKKLHNSNIVFENTFSVFDMLKKYEILAVSNGIVLKDMYIYVKNNYLHDLYHMYSSFNYTNKPCHNDLVCENFIQDVNRKSYMLDWEYSGMNDPIWDLATIFLELQLNHKDEQKLLMLYYGGQFPRFTFKKIKIYQSLMDILWYLWAELMCCYSVDYADYGYNRLCRAKVTIERILK